MTSPYVKNAMEVPKTIISVHFFKSSFLNVRNSSMKCPYLLRPKEEHFKVVLHRK